MSFQRYSKYRASGIAEIGNVPDHWRILRLRRVAVLNPSKSEIEGIDDAEEVTFLPMEAIGERGELDLTRVRPVGDVKNGYSYFADGDLLIAKVTPCFENGKGAIAKDLLRGIGFGTTELTVLRPKDRDDVQFLWWATTASEFRGPASAEMLGAGGLKRVPDEYVRQFQIAWPPASERTAIAAFLDRETAKIDALVAGQERLIALLKEKRQAVISHAVTKGLKPAAPMKDSGVEWLGQIPAHWEVRSFGSCVMIAEGQVDPRGEPFASMVLIAPNHIESGTGRLLELESAAEQGAESGKYQFEAGAVLYSKIRPALAKVAVAPQAGLCSADMYPLTPREVLSPAYLARLMLSPGFTAWAVLESDRVAMPKINREKLSALRLPVPPIHEQAEILSEVDRKCTQIDALVDKAELAIGLFAERRAALISAAVTGKIDVRGLAPVIETKPAAWVRDQVGAEIISLQAHKPKFGRVKFQKQIFLAETHVGVSEIGGRYQREAAGPYDRALIASVEKNLEDAGFMTVKQTAKGAAVTYHLKSGAKPDRDSLKAALGDRAEALAAMIKLTADLDTPAIEAVATLYAVWNDLLIDGQPAADDRIITGVLSEWHPEKAEKFNRDGLQSWLDWMRRHDLVPRGEGPKTQLGSLL
jgi:type I restriction enzyme, S subunit